VYDFFGSRLGAFVNCSCVMPAANGVPGRRRLTYRSSAWAWTRAVRAADLIGTGPLWRDERRAQLALRCPSRAHYYTPMQAGLFARGESWPR